MPDQASPSPFAQLIADAPLRLQSPPGLASSEAADGGRITAVERRQTPRASLHRRGAIQVSQPLPAITRAEALSGILVRDVSRRGLRFLYDEQLFPGEQVKIWLPDTELQGEVIRCRRLASHCYEIGVRLVDALASAQVRHLLSAADTD